MPTYTHGLRLAASPGPLRSLSSRRVSSVAAPGARHAPQRCRQLAVVPAARDGGRRQRGAPSGGGGRQRGPPPDAGQLIKQYAGPALGLLVVGTLVGPLVGALVMGALGLSMTIAAGAAALSLSWVFVPFLVAIFGLPALTIFGLPALMAGGMFATAAAGALLIPMLIQLMLVGGGLWLGISLAQRFFYGGGGAGDVDSGPNGTIDVEGRTVDDEWRDDMFKEKEKSEAELREFDDLLRRREEFKRGSGPPYT